jgi:hypothetical protein
MRYVKQALQAIDAADQARQAQAQVVADEEEEVTDAPND